MTTPCIDDHLLEPNDFTKKGILSQECSRIVLKCLLEMEPHDRVKVAPVLDQWMKFNRGLNQYEGDDYQTWVAQIYSQITALIEPE